MWIVQCYVVKSAAFSVVYSHYFFFDRLPSDTATLEVSKRKMICRIQSLICTCLKSEGSMHVLHIRKQSTPDALLPAGNSTSDASWW